MKAIKIVLAIFCTSLAIDAMADCVDPDLGKIPKGMSFTLCDGTSAVGTMVVPIACTADGEKDCIVKGTLKAGDTSSVTKYDLRYGKTLAGISGAHKDCRNGINSSLMNYDGAISGLPNAAIATGTTVDWWDTVDDFGSDSGQIGTFGPMSGSNAWNSDYYCDGSQISDVSSTATWLTPSGQKLFCSTSGTATCTDADNRSFSQIFFDPYTALYFTNSLINSGGAASAGADWAEAVRGCENIQSGDGIGKWRLPTQKEIMALYVGGISLRNTALFSGQLTDTFWAATSDSTGTTNAWYTQLWGGRTIPNTAKTSTYAVICVRSGSG